jgi:protein TonB
VDTAAPARQASAQYVSQLRAYLNSIKRYPNSREARQLRPTGVVKTWLDLDRSGQVIDAGIEASSGTALLDNEALRTLRTGHYPAFPAEAFGGEARHRFVVPLEYLVDGG